nr:putative inorganic carbon transporter subunit DabA [Halosimplex aquaticum]
MTLERATLEDSIDRAAETVGSVWPLHSFVTANPLAGFEDRPFHRAVAEAEQLFGGRGYPRPSAFRRAWEDGRIDPDVLADELHAHGVSGDPETLLDEMAAAESEHETEPDTATERVDRVLSKWLAAFLDQGQAEWPMPGRERGFYAAWRDLAPYDDEIPGCDDTSDLPESPVEALETVLSDCPEGRWEEIFEHHLAALPGWTGFIKQRADGHAEDRGRTRVRSRCSNPSRCA